MIIVIGLLAFALVAGLLLASNRSQGGPSSGETWRAFAQASGGTYTQNPFGRARKVTFTDGGRTITLEAWSTLSVDHFIHNQLGAGITLLIAGPALVVVRRSRRR